MGSRFPDSFCLRAKSINWVFSLLTPLLVIVSTYPDTQSCLLLCLHKVPLQCRPQTSWILVVISSHHLSVYIHEYEEQGLAKCRSLVQPHIHVESVVFASCNLGILVSYPQFNVLYQLNILVGYVALPRASPDLLPRYLIVCLGMKIA